MKNEVINSAEDQCDAGLLCFESSFKVCSQRNRIKNNNLMGKKLFTSNGILQFKKLVDEKCSSDKKFLSVMKSTSLFMDFICSPLFSKNNAYSQKLSSLLIKYQWFKRNSEYKTPLLKMMYYNKNLIPTLLASGCNINEVDMLGTNALNLSVRHQDLKLSTFLLKHGIKIPLMQNDGLFFFLYVSQNLPLLVPELIKHGMDPKEILRVDASGLNGLHHLLSCDSQYFNWKSKETIEEVKCAVSILIEAGVDINGRCQHGETPLMHACIRNYPVPVIEHLLKCGAKMEDKNIFGETAIWFTGNNPSVLKYLLHQGASLESKNILSNQNYEEVLRYSLATNDISLKIIKSFKEEKMLLQFTQDKLNTSPGIPSIHMGSTPDHKHQKML